MSRIVCEQNFIWAVMEDKFGIDAGSLAGANGLISYNPQQKDSNYLKTILRIQIAYKH